MNDDQYAEIIIADPRWTIVQGTHRFFGNVPDGVPAMERHTDPNRPFLVTVARRAQ